MLVVGRTRAKIRLMCTPPRRGRLSSGVYEKLSADFHKPLDDRRIARSRAARARTVDGRDWSVVLLTIVREAMPSPCGYDLADSDLIQVQEKRHFESREQPHVSAE